MTYRWGNDWDHLRDEMNRLLDRSAFGRGLFPGWLGRHGRFGRLNMTETADALTVECELPGVSKENVETSIDNGVLTIRGERRAPAGREDSRYRRREREFGPFERQVELPVKVDAERVHAKLSGGVLDVVMPKHPDSKPRRIEVKVG
jgi:HSP20 family protein